MTIQSNLFLDIPQSNQIHHSGQVNFADLQFVENLAVLKVVKNIIDMNNLYKKYLQKKLLEDLFDSKWQKKNNHYATIVCTVNNSCLLKIHVNNTENDGSFQIHLFLSIGKHLAKLKL